jgi:hypothetical protein
MEKRSRGERNTEDGGRNTEERRKGEKEKKSRGERNTEYEGRRKGERKSRK